MPVHGHNDLCTCLHSKLEMHLKSYVESNG